MPSQCDVKIFFFWAQNKHIAFLSTSFTPLFFYCGKERWASDLLRRENRKTLNIQGNEQDAQKCAKLQKINCRECILDFMWEKKKNLPHYI